MRPRRRSAEGSIHRERHPTKRRRTARGDDTPPPPWWGRAVSLNELASLEKRGEGSPSRRRLRVQTARVTPSPFASKLASSLRGEALPHQGGGGWRLGLPQRPI